MDRKRFWETATFEGFSSGSGDGEFGGGGLKHTHTHAFPKEVDEER